jgi:adenine-specific DNA-methyltransferase
MSFNTKLLAVLKKDRRFVDEDGELVLAAVQDHAWRNDHGLVRLLLTVKEIKGKFFDEIDGHWVFNLNEFIEYVSQKNFLDNSYTRFRNRIGLTVGGKYLRERGEVALVWPFKDCVLEGGQTKEEEKRKEIFFNEVLAEDEITRLLAPKVLTGLTRYTRKGKQAVGKIKRSENGTVRENLILRANNLLALYSLRPLFRGLVTLIYIDPPFNTGSDSFNYNDSFSHSTWLTYMKNRLTVARDFLAPDGNIFIHIDVNESHYLRILCDDIFGRANFVEEIIWSYGSPSGGRAAGAKPVNVHDYILHYAKDYGARRQYKVFTPYSEKYIADWFKFEDADKRRYQKRQRGRDEKGNAVWEKQYLDESKGVPLTTVWTDVRQVYADPRAYKENQAEHAELIRGFLTQKPERLMQRILEMASLEGDIVMDFQVGSGTTAAVAHKLKRQYIGVEQLDYGKNDVVARLQRVIKGDKTGISKDIKWLGGGEFVYCEFLKYNEAFIERIETAKTGKELVNIWQDMAEGSFLNWYINPEVPEDGVKDFEAIGQEEDGLKKQKRMLAELLDKNQLYVNLSEIDDPRYKVGDKDKAINKAFYGDAHNA